MKRKLSSPGRGATTSPPARFLPTHVDPFDDGWGSLDQGVEATRTTVTDEAARTIITRNQSPDIPFDRSINPYRGCEHGCSYCFARPSHAYLDLSPGLDFETRLFAKPQAADLLRAELARPGYRCRVIAIGTNTDPYQPVERRLRITRGVLEVLAQHRHPVGIVTKSNMVLRDLDLLAAMAKHNLVHVALSVTTLERSLARRMEPRAPTPERRIEAMRRLCAAGVPCSVMFAPVIPALNDAEMEAVLETAAAAGVRRAGYILLRLPLELKEIFTDWLQTHLPERADRILARIRDTRGGTRLNDARFAVRQRGEGPIADMLAGRFRLACRRLGLLQETGRLETALFRAPARRQQLPLFADAGR